MRFLQKGRSPTGGNMCEFCCNDKWKEVRTALAASALAKFAALATNDSTGAIDPFVEDAIRDFHDKNSIEKEPAPCEEFGKILVDGVMQIWPRLTTAEKFELALAGGAIRL
jgi:hypothetical protein